MRKLSQKREVVFSTCPKDLQVAASSWSIGGPGCDCRANAEKPSSNDFLSPWCLGLEGNEVTPSGSNVFVAAGPACRGQPISRYISQCAESGSKSFVVYTPKSAKVWMHLAEACG